MKRWETVGTARTPDGGVLTLRHHDGDFYIAADGYDLMTSRMHASEEALARLACDGLAPGASVLIGGLGLGYSLRAALDILGPEGRVTVAELLPEVVEWNRGPVAHLAGRPLEDARVCVHTGDVGDLVRRSDRAFDAILLDVDNGPDAPTVRSNSWLYTDAGLRAVRRALRPGGRFAVWSVDAQAPFVRRLERQGFEAGVDRVRSRGDRGPKHAVYVGRRR